MREMGQAGNRSHRRETDEAGGGSEKQGGREDRKEIGAGGSHTGGRQMRHEAASRRCKKCEEERAIRKQDPAAGRQEARRR